MLGMVGDILCEWRVEKEKPIGLKYQFKTEAPYIEKFKSVRITPEGL